jgi:hypothetical protein
MKQLMDINENPLKEGDMVECLRYNLGKCKLIKSGKSYVYQSIETGEEVSYLKMIDASTDLQKVKKIL